MMPEQPTLRQFIAQERARLLDQLWEDIVALRQLINETQQRMDATQRAARAQLITVEYTPSLSQRTGGSAQ